VPTSSRAERLGLAISVRYRKAGDQEWLLSHIANISESGVLFGPTTLEPGARVEVEFVSPVAIGSIGPGRLGCVGQIVRTTETGVVGVRFQQCRFLLDV